MSSLKFLGKALVIALIGATVHTNLQATPITWNGLGTDDDMNSAANWNPPTVPSTGDDAVFDNTITGINLNPQASSADFVCDNFNFPFQASPFTINVNNRQLIFDAFGIIGNTTNTTVNATNTNTTYTLGNQIFFNGPISTSNKALMTINNTSSITGAPAATFLSVVNKQLYSPNIFNMSSDGSLSVDNTGTDSSSGVGGNISAGVFQGQMIFDNECSLGDNTSIIVNNIGTNTSSSAGNFVGYVLEWQFHTGEDFLADDNLNMQVINSGIDHSISPGNQLTGSIGSVSGMTGLQIEIAGETRVREAANIFVMNSGTFDGTNTVSGCRAGVTLNEQARFRDAFESDDFLNLIVSNAGVDSATGVGGNSIGQVGAAQLRFDSRFETGIDSSVSVANFGNNTGTSNGAPNSVGAVFDEMIAFNGPVTAEDYFSLVAYNLGIDNATSSGSNLAGVVGSGQIKANDTFTVGDSAFIVVQNIGSATGSTTGLGNSVGFVQTGPQFSVQEFQAGDSLLLAVSNSGFDSTSGMGANNTGAVMDVTSDASQILFNDTVTIGKDAIIFISNTGTSSVGSSTSQGNKIGFLNQDQFHASGTFEADDDFLLQISNFGNSNSSLTGVEQVGAIATGLQACFSQMCTLADDASINISNGGIYGGQNTSNAYAGYVFDDQLCFEGQLNAGNNFNLEISNEGFADTIKDGNFSGYVAGQLDIDQGCNLGDDATIKISNLGINWNFVGENNNVGSVNGDQVFIANGFNAGKNLEFTVTNKADNTGNPNNIVGNIGGNQLNFSGDVNLNDNSLILAINDGSVNGDQMMFQDGFNVLSGKATLKAINNGTVTGKGIHVLGGTGANVNINLTDSSFYVDTGLPTFTIGELNGDATSIAQSGPELIIDTDALTKNADFAGSIQDFPSTVSSLRKKGRGTQKLSGINTYTGITYVDEGNFVLDGSVASDVIVDTFGTLKGNGTIGGKLINYGTVSPGESIGILTVLDNYYNVRGTYDVEVNGQGESDLLHVLGTTQLVGGSVIVGSSDGTFRIQQRYTIVLSEDGVLGTYDQAIPSGFFKPVLTYDANHVYLTIFSDLSRAARACNQLGVAESLDAIINPNGVETNLINIIANLSLAGAQAALESFSGYQYTHEVWVTDISTRRFIRRLYDPLRSRVSYCGCCAPCSEWTSWFDTGGGTTSVRGNKAHNMHFDSYEITGGVQKRFLGELILGAAGSYEWNHVKHRNGSSNRSTGFLAAYGLYRPCAYYALADFVYGHTCSKFCRRIHAGTFQDKIHSKPNLNTLAVYGEAGYDFEKGCILIQPFLGFQVGRNWRDHVRENRAEGWELAINKHNWCSVTSRLGVHFTKCRVYDGIDASFDLAWNRLLSSPKNSTQGRFRRFGESFRICGNHLDKNGFDYALTLCACPCEGVKGYIELAGESWEHANNFDASVGIELSW